MLAIDPRYATTFAAALAGDAIAQRALAPAAIPAPFYGPVGAPWGFDRPRIIASSASSAKPIAPIASGKRSVALGVKPLAKSTPRKPKSILHAVPSKPGTSAKAKRTKPSAKPLAKVGKPRVAKPRAHAIKTHAAQIPVRERIDQLLSALRAITARPMPTTASGFSDLSGRGVELDRLMGLSARPSPSNVINRGSQQIFGGAQC
jgi:hypothetical protein